MTASMMVWKLGGAGAALLACGLTLDTGAQRSQMEARENSKAEPVLVERAADQRWPVDRRHQ
jgi:hypothetical protein